MVSGLHGPEILGKLEFGSGVIVSVSTAKGLKFAVQVAGGPQLIPAGEEVTVPVPAPIFEMVKTDILLRVLINSVPSNLTRSKFPVG